MGIIKDPFCESEFRRQAEEKLKDATSGSAGLSGVSPERMATLIHELEVHQIELKMQNDELRRIQGELEKARDRYSHLYDFSPVGYVTMTEKGIIDEANLTLSSMFDAERSALIGNPFTRFVLREDQNIFYKLQQRLLETETSQSCELRLVKKDGREFHAIMECMVIKNMGVDLRQIRTAVSDITERKLAEEHRDKLIVDLKTTLSEVNTLRGFLPICSNCKNIRDDKGYWSQIETYISKHSEAVFSHGICPDCAKKLYPDLDSCDENGTQQ